MIAGRTWEALVEETILAAENLYRLGRLLVSKRTALLATPEKFLHFRVHVVKEKIVS